MELGLNSAEKKLVIDIHLKKLHNKITLASLFKFLNTILQHKAQRTKTMRQLLPFIATFVVYLRKFRAQQFKIFTKVYSDTSTLLKEDERRNCLLSFPVIFGSYVFSVCIFVINNYKFSKLLIVINKFRKIVIFITYKLKILN